MVSIFIPLFLALLSNYPEKIETIYTEPYFNRKPVDHQSFILLRLSHCLKKE